MDIARLEERVGTLQQMKDDFMRSLQQVEQQRNILLTEIVKCEGKLEELRSLLGELQADIEKEMVTEDVGT